MNRKCLILAAIAASVLLCHPASGLAGPVPVLGSATDFAVLGATTVTNTGSTTLVGSPSVNANLGLYSGTSITGLGPGPDQVTITNGTVEKTTAAAQQAQVDLTKAYTALGALAPTQPTPQADLGGLTLLPGVYHFDSSAAITGLLKLDAQNTDGVYWVFQIPSTLTTAATNSIVQLINANASGNNGADIGVFWLVGSSATLGTYTTFEGNILASESISLLTGATILNGRALAQTGAVSMDTNAISDICPSNNNGPGFSGGLMFAGEGSTTLVPIPEPCTILLLGSGLAGLFAARRRSRSAV